MGRPIGTGGPRAADLILCRGGPHKCGPYKDGSPKGLPYKSVFARHAQGPALSGDSRYSMHPPWQSA
jgi:hypothetical protein